MFVYSDLTGDKSNNIIQAGIFISMNRSSIHLYNNSQSAVESSNFGSDLCVINIGVEMVEYLRYKLRMFGVPIYGYRENRLYTIIPSHCGLSSRIIVNTFPTIGAYIQRIIIPSVFLRRWLRIIYMVCFPGFLQQQGEGS